MGTQFNDIILEQVSATKTRIEDRKLWNQIKSSDVKKIVITEISRIGRNTRDGLILLEYITKEREDLEIFVHPHQEMSAEEAFIFDLQVSLAKREVKFLGERTKIGIQRAREKGIHIGRPFGSTIITIKKTQQIDVLLELGEKKAVIANVVGISRTTLYNYLKD